MALVNMQMDAEEAKEYSGVPTPGDTPKYPWGLCITLDDGSLEKLGVSQLPQPGDVVMITAQAVVTSVSANAQMNGDSESCVSLQITDMQLGPAQQDSAAKSARTASALWGSEGD